MDLTPEEVRVLGCLIEKSMTTPDVYPLTLNALITACNQTTSREPVVDYDSATVKEALDHLRARHRYVRVELPSHGSRVEKFKQVLHEQLQLTPGEMAVVGVLMLRGPQTLNEVMTRTERLHAFASTTALETVIDRLCDPTIEADPAEFTARVDAGALRPSLGAPDPEDRPAGYRRPWTGPLVLRVERQPGQKEARIAQLLGGPIDAAVLSSGSTPPRSRDAAGRVPDLSELRGEIEALRAGMESLRAEFETFKSQFG